MRNISWLNVLKGVFRSLEFLLLAAIAFMLFSANKWLAIIATLLYNLS